MTLRRFATLLLVAAPLLGAAAPACAQAYPDRTIRIIDGFPAGGAADFLARVLGPRLTTVFGRQIVVENRPGAASNVGAAYVAKSPPDGYTLFMGLVTAMAASPSLYSKMSYDVANDLAAVSRVATGMNVLVAHPSLPVRSLRDIVALARTRPGELKYGSGGVGAGTHLCGELFKHLSGADLRHVPYKGGPLAVTALISGEVELAFMSTAAGIAQINAGRVRPIAVTGASRDVGLPQVPTFREAGFPAYDVTVTFGLFAPAGTAREIVERLNAELGRALAVQEIRERFATQGFLPSHSTPEELAAVVRTEITQWAQVIKAAGIRVE